MVHITGDPSWIRGELRPQGVDAQRVPGLHAGGDEGRGAPAWRSRRSLAFRDGGCVLPPPPSPELMHEMMAFLACAPVADDVVADVPRGPPPRRLRRARDHVGRRDPRRRQGRRARRRDRLRRSRACSPASAWRRPGCRSRSSRRTAGPAARGGRTATRAHGSTSAATSTATRSSPADHWTEYFSQHPELREYFERVMRKYGVDAHCRFEHRGRRRRPSTRPPAGGRSRSRNARRQPPRRSTRSR